MNLRCLSALVLTFLIPCLVLAAEDKPAGAAPVSPRIVFQAKDWPLYFEINPGEVLKFDLEGRSHTFELVSLSKTEAPNRWIVSGRPQVSIEAFSAVVRVDGVEGTVVARPYQMPQTVGGLRVYLESLWENANEVDFSVLENVTSKARFSVRPAGSAWGPADLRFPLTRFRWNGTTFSNTWSARVPSDRVYYHRGEDYGAIPYKHEVIAVCDGVVSVTPLPWGDKGSNAVFVKRPDGVSYRLAHMNIETISRDLVKGAPVKAGAVLGQNGHTRDGKEVMLVGAHLHYDLRAAGTRLGSYPFNVESYYRDYPDKLRAVAGGCATTIPGRAVALDASRSDARPGETLAAYEWRLSDGRVVQGAQVSMTYERPGVYSEELRVRTASGAEAVDFLEVVVFDPSPEAPRKQLPRGWILAYPMRDVRPGETITFFYGCPNATEESTIDFGDGTPARTFETLTAHTYDKPGSYVVIVKTPAPGGHMMTRRLWVPVGVSP